MKISVCGKGGSGKSTIVVLLANEALKRGYQVLVVDSDESNSGLFRMLGFDRPPVPLMELVGGKKGLRQKMGQPSVLSETNIQTAQIPEEYLLKKNGLKLTAIGKILQSLEGCACPMGVLSREFLKKLDLAKDELAIVDMEAGVEHFGRGVETSIDSVLIVVEPPLESVNVGQKIHELASGIGIKNVWAVLNKVPTEEIATRLKAELQERHIEVVGCIYFDADIFNSSIEGRIPVNGVTVREIKEVMNGILSRAGMPTPE
ncbi:MAG: adenylyl-sulfate kinase [Dehalococcoidales bacterium]|nr:adenylyl-sulfate kinase [Dehalococcoidales bacterium]MCK4354412.1 adenylyl-sulfate kinase [Dehalococcoidia bacterium]